MLFVVSLGALSGATLFHWFCGPIALLPFYGVMIGILLLCITFRSLTHFILYRNILVFLFSVIIFWTCSYYQIITKLHARPVLHYSKEISLAGKIVHLEKAEKDTWCLDVMLENHSPWKVRLYWSKPTILLQEGDLLSVNALLKPVWGHRNPASVDSEKFYFLESIVAKGKIRSLLSHQPSDAWTLAQFRRKLSERMAQALDYAPGYGVIQALTVGERTHISHSEWQVFQRTGTSHVVAISGLHIGLVAGFVGGFTFFCCRRVYWLTLYYPAQHYAAMSALVSAILYSVGSGFSIPTQRACLMIAVACLAQLINKPISVLSTLYFALILILFFENSAVLQSGFWLSFFCVAVLMMGASHYSRSSQWRQTWIAQWMVFISLLPLTHLFFHQISWISLIANLFFVPIISFFIVPLSLLGSLGVPFCLKIALWILSFCWKILTWMAAHSWSVSVFPTLPGWVTIFSLAGVALLLLPNGFPARKLGWFAFLPLFFSQLPSLGRGEFLFTLWDVGQGLAAIVQTQQHTLIYDVGPQYGEEQDAGARIILPYLRAYNITKVDKIVISHGDWDHRGGMRTLQYFPHQELITSEPERVAEQAIKCPFGEEWIWDGVHFQFLNPIVQHAKHNNLSCVLKVSAGENSVLLTGDIEELAEQAMLKSGGDTLKSSILVVPHHGSRTSSSEAFIDRVQPDYALFPVGKDNHYRFPRAEIVDRYRIRGTQIFLTWETGAVQFHIKENEPILAPVLARTQQSHYWNSHITENS